MPKGRGHGQIINFRFWGPCRISEMAKARVVKWNLVYR